MSELAVTDSAPHQLAALSSAGELCPGCRRSLPIRARRPNELFAHWECAACRSPLTGVLVNDITPQMAESIRIAQIHFDTRDAAPMPQSMRELLKEFAKLRQQKQTPIERRALLRVPQQLDVIVVPVGEHWTPRGKPVLGMVVDITSQGLGMVTTSLGGVGHVVIQISHQKGFVQLLGRIDWTKDLGQGFQDSGVQFLLRFGPALAISGLQAPSG
jgi:hypothetical protein